MGGKAVRPFSGEGAIGIGLALLGFLGMGALVVWPTQVWLGWGLMGFASVGLVLLALHQFLGFEIPPLTNFALRRVPLLRAARLAFEASEGGLGQKLIDGLDGDSEQERIDHHVGSILNNRIRMWGRSPPSRILRPIPEKGRSTLKWSGAGSGLVAVYAGQAPSYADVAVSRADLSKLVARNKRLAKLKF
jgi:hypothetical protein